MGRGWDGERVYWGCFTFGGPISKQHGAVVIRLPKILLWCTGKLNIMAIFQGKESLRECENYTSGCTIDVQPIELIQFCVCWMIFITNHSLFAAILFVS